MTLHELAAEYGVSAERIRQIEVAAMKKMRKALEATVTRLRRPPRFVHETAPRGAVLAFMACASASRTLMSLDQRFGRAGCRSG